MSKRTNHLAAAVGEEIGVLQQAVEGVRVLSEWAYEQTDGDARRALPRMESMLELISGRMRDLQLEMLGESPSRRHR